MSLSRILSPLLVLALPALAVAQQFVYNAAALPAQNVWTDGVAIADVDADGDNDIMFANGSVYGGTGAQGAQPQHLFLNNGAGTFVAAHAQLNVANFNAKMVIAEDFDNDGDLDLFYASGSTGSPPRLLLNNGAGVFTDVTGTNVPALALRSFAICAGDVDNDGDLDVAVSDGGTFGGIATQLQLLQNNGSAVFTNVTATNLPVNLFNCQDATMFDFDGDFDIDIALTGKAGSRLYLNNGSGVFSVNTVLNAVATSNTYEIDWGDLDGDSDFDSAVQSIAGFGEGWARNDGTGTPVVKTTFPAPNGDDDNEMALYDYDNDGDLDVFVGSLAGGAAGAEKIYTNTGAVFAKAAGAVSTGGDSTLDFGIGDLNGDDKADMVTGQGESGNFTNKVYFNNGPADTLAPTFEGLETPAAIGASGTVFRTRVQDAISDDGHVNVTATFAWSTTGAGAGSGSGTAVSQGGGQFRAVVPTTAGTTGATLTWTVTDSAGNVAVSSPIVVGGSPWTDLGFALAGVSGDPLLVGTGSLTVGSSGTIALSNAAPSALTSLFISLSSTPSAFKGGTLVPVPPAFTLNLSTNGSGGILIPFVSWPAGLSGADLFFQYAIQDGVAIHNVSLSNALKADVP